MQLRYYALGGVLAAVLLSNFFCQLRFTASLADAPAGGVVLGLATAAAALLVAPASWPLALPFLLLWLAAPALALWASRPPPEPV